MTGRLNESARHGYVQGVAADEQGSRPHTGNDHVLRNSEQGVRAAEDGAWVHWPVVRGLWDLLFVGAGYINKPRCFGCKCKWRKFVWNIAADSTTVRSSLHLACVKSVSKLCLCSLSFHSVPNSSQKAL